jgi:DNA primase
MISPETIDNVHQLSIVDVVSNYVPDLKKAGTTYRARSPFTDDKTPSFYVVPQKNIFKCFSSGKGGGAVKFVMELTGKSYPQAIEEIAKAHNIAVQYETNGQQPKEYYEQLELLYKINQATANRYAEMLLEVDAHHDAFKELIDKRRFSADTIVQWQIGYAPGDIAEYRPERWRFLSEVLVQKGFYEAGIELGLIKTKNQVNYDVFRNRVIFPIIDHNERYVGFGGRALKSDQYNAKYINSPESRIFNKSKILFGLHFAGNAIRKQGYANLMEGYTDVISFHQAGLTNSVGTCGTALTEDQCKLLKKYTTRVVLFGDGDRAGQSAVLRSIDILMSHGLQTSVVPMPAMEDGRKVDPDELTRMFL